MIFSLSTILNGICAAYIVGYTMGDGFGWLGCKHSFAADSVKEADVVTADGELVKANAHENADHFWGLKGGGGNFGIVTSLEFALCPITHVYGGNLFYPIERAAEVLELYGRWSAGLSDEVTSAVAFMNFPRSRRSRSRCAGTPW